jgi:GMP synthase-like glutamine amidotransferase
MKTLRIHYLQHVPFEDLGCIEDWISVKGYSLSSTKFYNNNQLPELSTFDWLILMGGPMSVNDEEKFEWLISEKEFIRNAIQVGKTVIGICLGAQLIASSLGAKVYPNHEKEIGWFPISISRNKLFENILGHFTSAFPVLQWHGDTFDLPANSIRVASSEACTNQAFIYKEKVLGLQFHLESTVKSITQMVTSCSNDLENGKYIQSATEILGNTRFIENNNKKMYKLLDYLDAQ